MSEITLLQMEAMVKEFYTKVVADEMIGHYFIKILGDDLKNAKWYEHIKRLTQFWFAMLGRPSSYKGDPVAPHLFVGEINDKELNRWVELFSATVHEHFDKESAKNMIEGSEVMAHKIKEFLALEDDEW